MNIIVEMVTGEEMVAGPSTLVFIIRSGFVIKNQIEQRIHDSLFSAISKTSKSEILDAQAFDYLWENNGLFSVDPPCMVEDHIIITRKI